MSNLLDALFRFPNAEEAGPEFVGSVLNLISLPAVVVDRKMKVRLANLRGRDLLPARGKKAKSSPPGGEPGSFPALLREEVKKCLKDQQALLVRDFGAPGLRRERYDVLLSPGEIRGRQRCFILLLSPGSEANFDLDSALKQVVEQINGAAAFLNTDARFLEFNQRYLDAFEATDEEMRGLTLSDRNPSRQAAILENQIKYLIAHREVRDTTADSLTTAKRGIVVASLKAWPLTSADESALGLFVIIRPSPASTPLPQGDRNAQELFGKAAMLFGPPMFFTHLDGKVIAMNVSGRGLLRTESDHESNLKTSMPWDSPDMIENLYQEMLAGSDYSGFLTDITGPAGTRIFMVRAFGLKEIGDITSVVLVHVEDVTEAERARNQLAETARKLSTEKDILGRVVEGLSAVGVAYAVVDRDLTMVRVSDSVLEAFDKDVSFFVGKKAYDVDPSIRDSGILAYIKTTVDRGKPMHIDRFSYTLPTGRETILALGFHPIKVDGKAACLIMVENLTKLEQTQTGHARVKRRLDTLLKYSDEVVVFTDPEGKVTGMGELALGKLGKTVEDVIGQPIEDLIKLGVDEVDRFRYFIRQAIVTRKPVETGRINVISEKSGPIFLEATYVPLIGPDGSVDEVAHIVRYRTEVADLEQQVQEYTNNLQRLVGERTAELSASNVQLENMVERLAFMARSGMVLSSLKDGESVMASFLKEVREVLGADFASVALISATGETSKTTYYSSGAAPPPGEIPSDVMERGLARLAVGNGPVGEIESESPNVLIEEFAFSGFRGVVLAWRESSEFTALDGNLGKLLCTQISFSLPITRYVTDLRLVRDRSQALRRIAFRTASSTSVASAVGIVAEELARVVNADRFFWLVSGSKSDLWLSEIYRGSGLPVRHARHVSGGESGCVDTVLEACHESHRLFCERFPRFGGDGFGADPAAGVEAPCPFLRKGEGTELTRCLKTMIKQAGLLGREDGTLAVAPVTLSPTSWGMLCAFSDIGGAFSQDDCCFMCLAASTVGHMWQAADAAGSVRRLEAEGETVSELAHDLKYPLMRMRDSISNLASGEQGLKGGEIPLEALGTEVDRLNLLARELIDISNRKKQRSELVDMAEILDYCIQITSGDASERSIDMRKHVKSTPPPIFADPQDIKNILINLLANAIDAAGTGGWVDITVEANGARAGSASVVVTIQNSGPAIPEAELGLIFDPFFSTKEEGSGVGLFSSKKRARANAGDLACEIGDDGKSRFVVWFPQASG